MSKIFLPLLCICIFAFTADAQKAVIIGKVTDSTSNLALEDANIFLNDSTRAITDGNGNYRLEVPAGQDLLLYFSFVTKVVKIRVTALAKDEVRTVNAQIRISTRDIVIVEVKGREVPSTITLKPKDAGRFPGPGSFENILKTLPGVSGNNELSSGFNVRGGNYDENLIYVNDVEVYRPQLIRSGQQEGMSFINSDLVENITFSAGGFQARYGDKMSSVLDIQYRKPDSFATGFRISLLGAQGYIEDRPTKRFSYMLGARYRSNSYLFGTFDLQGDYKPRFGDIQALLNYKLNSTTDLSYMGAFASSSFLFIPQSQRTTFGTVTQALQLTVYFNGGEHMKYITSTHALTLKLQPSKYLQVKIIGSAINSTESEFYTVEGAYRLDELDRDLGSSTFGQAKFNRGAGYFINHARNQLQVNAYSGAVKSSYYRNKWNVQWGLDYRHENISDVLNEWVYNDSVDYSVPFNSGDSLFIFSTIRGKNTLSSSRYSAYVQQTWVFDPESNFTLNVGLRSNYWTLNQQNVVSPRMQLSFEPNRRYNRTADLPDSMKKRDMVLKAAWGIYYQPPFYRELRQFSGQVNTSVMAQRSIHFVLGSDIYFQLWGRPFKFFGELYYKKLDFLDPYLYENVRIRYYANNNSRGYATGLDTRVNGEFIKGMESWFSLSFMQTKERITYTNESGQTVESDWLRRPTDQRINLGIFFQDNLPILPDCKVHLNTVFGSGMPYYLSGKFRYVDDYRIPAYTRVDIGFSYDLISEKKPSEKRFWKGFRDLALSLDLFNMMGVKNTASYTWVRDVNGATYGVPNYLTGRRLNLNVIANF